MSKLSLTSAQVLSILAVWGVKSHKATVAILAVRDADGDGNEAGVFDDRFYIVGSDGGVFPFEGNTDPTSPWVTRRATMETGQIVTYQAGKHKWRYPEPRGYAAFRQVSKAYIRRRDVGREFANIAANIHRGSASGGTISEACQTVPASKWSAFKSKVYAYLGVTDSDVRSSPLGTGPIFEYLILSRADVDAALQKSKKLVLNPVAPSEAAPTFTYILPTGKHIEGVQMVVGVGYAPSRTTLAAMLGIAEPEKLNFQFGADGEDDDAKPDLAFVDAAGTRHPIAVLDSASSKTMGRITDLATAAGLVWAVDKVKHIVTIYAPEHKKDKAS